MPSRRATSLRLSGTSSLIYFNSRPHGGRPYQRYHDGRIQSISTHALTEGDQTARQQYAERQEFQLTPSRRATDSTPPMIFASIYFNSRPHGGRLLTTPFSSFKLIFQLTPSRRATYDFPERSLKVFVFQLTPSRRATRNRNSSACVLLFQLTPSRRATFQTLIHSLHLPFQLTPSRRATGSTTPQYPVWNISTHALTEGDLRLFSVCLPGSYFNSRPHGGRRPDDAFNHSSTYFNSRPHGGRLDSFQCGQIVHISTHALTEGDVSVVPSALIADISTHALTEGDCDDSLNRSLQNYFNSRPHGGRRTESRPCPGQMHFNSRPHGGRPLVECA